MANVQSTIPLNGESILKAFNIAGNSAEVVAYLHTSLQSPAVVNAFASSNQASMLTNICDNVQLQCDYLDDLSKKRNIWGGDVVSIEKTQPTAANFQLNEAVKQLQQLAVDEKDAALQHITLVYQMNDNAQFLRGYVQNDQVLDANNAQDEKVLNVVDQIFQSWLVENSMESRDGVIYKVDDAAEQQHVDPHVFATVLNDPVRGLNAFAKTVDNNFDIAIHRQQAELEEGPI